MYSTAVGYAGGTTRHPSYEETCSGRTGHAEVVQVVYDTNEISTGEILTEFWSDHRPVSSKRSKAGGQVAGLVGSRDAATDQYRSIILTTSREQLDEAVRQRALLDAQLDRPGQEIATQIKMLDEFYYAEDYHQQYVAKRAQRYVCR